MIVLTIVIIMMPVVEMVLVTRVVVMVLYITIMIIMVLGISQITGCWLSQLSRDAADWK